MSRIVFTYTFLVLGSFLFASNAIKLDDVETVKIYTAGTNTKDRIKVVEGEYGISNIYFFRKRDTRWMKAHILSIDTIQEYLKVKIIGTDETFELFIEWNNDKMTTIDSKQKKVIYWLTKS